MKYLRSRRFFTIWFGVGIPPFLVGTVVVAFWQGLVFGLVTTVITCAWIWDTFSTTCRRCPFYGTGHCGLPGRIVPLLFKRRSAFDIGIGRVRLHFYADAAMILYVNFVYAHLPVVFPIVAACSVIGWLTVFRPGRFHGLLFRLSDRPAGRRPHQHHSRVEKLGVSFT